VAAAVVLPHEESAANDDEPSLLDG
jgi:hypothetical protein